MDEEVSIINTNTRNEKIKNFFVNNKNKISPSNKASYSWEGCL